MSCDRLLSAFLSNGEAREELKRAVDPIEDAPSEAVGTHGPLSDDMAVWKAPLVVLHANLRIVGERLGTFRAVSGLQAGLGGSGASVVPRGIHQFVSRIRLPIY